MLYRYMQLLCLRHLYIFWIATDLGKNMRKTSIFFFKPVSGLGIKLFFIFIDLDIIALKCLWLIMPITNTESWNIQCRNGTWKVQAMSTTSHVKYQANEVQKYNFLCGHADLWEYPKPLISALYGMQIISINLLKNRKLFMYTHNFLYGSHPHSDILSKLPD